MNIKRTILRGLAFATAVLLFAGSVGFNVDFHYCSGELKSYNFFGKAESCHQKEGVFCPVHQKMMIMGNTGKFDCCKNESVYFQSDQDVQFEASIPAQDIQFEKPVLPPVILLTLSERAFLGKKIHPPPEPEPPPPYRRNIQVWYQSFLC